jgi:predicted nucleic acid-binding protein
MSFMNALDTNIWIYSHDSRDAAKQTMAQHLINNVRPLALPWQVGCEFIAASRKLHSLGFTEDHAWLALTAMQGMADAILLPAADLWAETHALQGTFSLSFWDALLAAACIRGGVLTLYSDNLGSSPSIHGLSIVNPFTPGSTP